jgi:hypothetical protein
MTHLAVRQNLGPMQKWFVMEHAAKPLLCACNISHPRVVKTFDAAGRPQIASDHRKNVSLRHCSPNEIGWLWVGIRDLRWGFNQEELNPGIKKRGDYVRFWQSRRAGTPFVANVVAPFRSSATRADSLRHRHNIQFIAFYQRPATPVI